MKEITRIHIARTPYDIEVEARKELEKYLKNLKDFSADTDVLEDVEIRITEILAEHGIEKNGIISMAEVKALRQQLGEPEEFMDGDSPEKQTVKAKDEIQPKLFRDVDNAVLGGVLGGIAAYFKVEPLWIRLAFIVLLVLSFGSALLVYAVLWLVVPAAKTSADKLQMAGRPVTINSIREMNEIEANNQKNRSSVPVSRVITFLLGIGAGIAAITSFAFTASVTWSVLFGVNRGAITAGSPDFGLLLAGFILAVVSGLLLAILCTLIAVSFFKHKVTKRALAGMGAVILAGTVTFLTAMGLWIAADRQHDSLIRGNTREIVLTIPAETKQVKSLIADVPRGTEVYYLATEDKAPHAKIRATASSESAIPKPEIKMEGSVLKVSSDKSVEPFCASFLCDGITTSIIYIYGPELDDITTKPGVSLHYVGARQSQLKLDIGRQSDVLLLDATINTVDIRADAAADIMAGSSTVSHLKAMLNNSSLEFGTVETMTISDQKACPSGSKSFIEVGNVTKGTFMLNNQEYPVRSAADFGCTNISIEEDIE